MLNEKVVLNDKILDGVYAFLFPLAVHGFRIIITTNIYLIPLTFACKFNFCFKLYFTL